MTLPFVRQYPNRRVLTELDGLTVVVENIGREFIAKGGVYLIEILRSGQVRVAATLQDPAGNQHDVEVAMCANDKDMLPVITRLIVASVKHVKGRKAVEPEAETAH